MTERNQTAARRTADFLVTAAFLMGIAVPFVGFVDRIQRGDPVGATQENRTLAPLPRLSLQRQPLAGFPRKFEDYFNDRFGLRNTLVACQSTVKVMLLGMSTTNQVIIGRERWLFYAHQNVIIDYRGDNPFLSEELRYRQLVLEERRDYLASMGIRYLLFIAPEKSTIYPEYLPEFVNRGKRPSRLDQFMAYMKRNSDVEIVDLREPLLRAKREGQIYRRTDTHWNDAGAFVAYEEVAKHLAKHYPAVKPLDRSAFDVREVEDYGPGDLAKMLGVANQLTDSGICFLRRSPTLAHEAEHGKLQHAETYNASAGPTVMTQENADLPSAVILCDSFMTFIAPWLSEHFRRSVYLWDAFAFDPAAVEAEKPDVVIEEMVERRLSWRFGNPPRVREFTLRKGK